MIWFYNLNIAKKLALSFAVVIALALLQGLFAMKELKQVNSASGEIVNKWMPTMDAARELQGSSPPLRLNELELVTAVTPQERTAANQSIKKRLDALAKQRAVFEQRMSEPEEKEQYAQFGKNLAAYLKVDEQLAEMAANQQYDETRALFNGESASSTPRWSATSMPSSRSMPAAARVPMKPRASVARSAGSWACWWQRWRRFAAGLRGGGQCGASVQGSGGDRPARGARRPDPAHPPGRPR
jgi:hypothetical protein